MKSILLKTNRLILRPPAPEDAAAIQHHVSDRRIADMTALIPHPYPAGGALEWFRRSDEPLGSSRGGERFDRVCYGVTAAAWRENLRVFSHS